MDELAEILGNVNEKPELFIYNFDFNILVDNFGTKISLFSNNKSIFMMLRFCDTDNYYFTISSVLKNDLEEQNVCVQDILNIHIENKRLNINVLDEKKLYGNIDSMKKFENISNLVIRNNDIKDVSSWKLFLEIICKRCKNANNV